MSFGTVGVIGIGNIGSSVVADLVLHGISVVGIDLSEPLLTRAKEAVIKDVRFAPLLRKGFAKLSREEVLRRVVFSTDIKAAVHCELIIENITEDWEMKAVLYKTLDEILPPDVPIAANTSCISITRLGSLTKRADKIVGTHFMNPVYLKPTVEVIRGSRTSDATLSVINRLFIELGKEAIVVGDLPGFVSNRISHLFMNEAAFVFQDGVATPDQIDSIFKKCFGHKMGPLETADLIGLDTVVRSLDVLFDSFHDPKFRCCPVLRKMVDAGDFGVKSGRGFYAYPQSGG